MAKKSKIIEKTTYEEVGIPWLAPVSKYGAFILLALSFLLYANTLGHGYAQDDAIVITDNMYTQQGVEGIPGILTKDTFFGFFKEEGKANLVSGGRYRPLSLCVFAVMHELFGASPLAGHLFNVLMYGLLGMIIYFTCLQLFQSYKSETVLIAFAISLIYIVHPIHTEVVANIKGLDEILSMMGSMAALYFILKYVDGGKLRYLLFASLTFFLGLMSKENAITFLAVIPFSLYFFRDQSLLKSLKYTLPLLLASGLFLAIRYAILGFEIGTAPLELMNNPFVKVVDYSYVPFALDEKMATIIFTLGKYLQLLFFPHPLTHDYYPRHIEIMNFGDASVWLSILMYGTMIALVVMDFKKRSVMVFGILYFLITTSIVSNILFPIGTNMSERFMFMPSLGFAVVCGWYLMQKFISQGSKWPLTLIGIFVVMSSWKTIDRNTVWKDDFTLFTTDIHNSPNSAKLCNAAGGALSNAAMLSDDPVLQEKYVNEAIGYLQKAIEIHPNYKNAYLILGNCYHLKKEYQTAQRYYDNALKLDPNFKDAYRNQGINYREIGRDYGVIKGDLNNAISNFLESLKYDANDYETNRLLGIAYGRQGNHTEAVKYFEKTVQLKPENAIAYVNLAKAYNNLGDISKAQINFNKAREIDPNVSLD